MVSQGFVDRLDRVYRDGDPYVGTAVRIEVRRRPDRGLEEAFIDFVLQPLRDINGEISGILVHGVDITEQNRRTVRDRFLLALDDALRQLTAQAEIVAECTRLLGTHMNVDRCAFSLVEEDEDTFEVAGEYNRHTTSLTGRRHLSDFGEEARRLLRLDEAYVVNDIDTHQPAPTRLDAYRGMMIHAVIAAPLLRDGRLAAILVVNQSTPRDWRPEEVSLVRHVARRCHESLERARVARELVESEARFRNMADFAPVMIWLARADGSAEYLNKRWLEFTGQTQAEATGFGWLQALHEADQGPASEKYAAATRRHAAADARIPATAARRRISLVRRHRGAAARRGWQLPRLRRLGRGHHRPPPHRGSAGCGEGRPGNGCHRDTVAGGARADRENARTPVAGRRAVRDPDASGRRRSPARRCRAEPACFVPRVGGCRARRSWHRSVAVG